MTTEDVKDALELDLILGRIKPGDRLIEDNLIQRFGVKRHMVRSALERLERMGLVERPQNKGAHVRVYSEHEVDELTSLREDLMHLAVQHMRLPISSEVAAELRSICAAHKEAVESQDQVGVVHHNNAFHLLLFKQCGNRFLVEAIERTIGALKGFRSQRVNNPEIMKRAAEEHELMIQAATQGDRDFLATLCVGHLGPALKSYLDNREDRDEKGEPG